MFKFLKLKTHEFKIFGQLLDVYSVYNWKLTQV